VSDAALRVEIDGLVLPSHRDLLERASGLPCHMTRAFRAATVLSGTGRPHRSTELAPFLALAWIHPASPVASDHLVAGPPFREMTSATAGMPASNSSVLLAATQQFSCELGRFTVMQCLKGSTLQHLLDNL
jgi:hypothetical protein